MYAISKTIHFPTQVEHSIYCNFYSYNERNLVTAGATQLKVYRLVKSVKSDLKNFSDEYSEHSFSDNVKLECIQSFTLNSNIQSLNYVSFNGANRDCLLLAFNNAKLSIVEYDPNTHDLKTISMHYFEDDDMKDGHITYVRPPIVRVDPENRCTAMLIYSKNIVIIPFRKEIVMEDTENLLISPGINNNNLSSVLNKKSPVLPSYKLDLNYELYGVNIINIVDIQFLHNYYEPTLLILYEPIRTWSGRVAVRQDTVSMITLSLDVHQRVHPHIWSLNNLPFNTFAALPVPKPIGGVIIFAANSLIHLNQGLPPFGVSLNNFNDGNTSFPLKTQDNVILSLDCSHAIFISNNKILLSLKNGDLFLLKLHNDMTRSIRTFNFTCIASSVIATTLVKCEEGFLFIGSRLSPSLLVHYLEKSDTKQNVGDKKSQQITSQTLSSLIAIPGFNENEKSEDEYLYGDDFCNSQKKIKTDNEMDEEIQNDNSVEVELDNTNNDKYNNSSEANDHLLKVHNSHDKSSYSLTLCDIIHNIGPCGSVCLGEVNMNLENMANVSDFDVEVVATSGYSKNGAISVLQRSIIPQIETSFKLPGCLDTWTVYGPNYYSDKDSFTHKYLILSQEDSTIVFQIDQEINELDQSGFITQSATVFAGNLGQNKYILQVSATSVRLLDGTHELQHFPLDIGSPIVRTSMADPYSVLMTQSGTVILLRLKIDPQKGSAHLVVTKPDLTTAKSKIVALCVYKDVSGLFKTETKIVESKKAKKSTVKKQMSASTSLTSTLSNLISASTADEEDELLYGDSTINFLNNNDNEMNEEEEEEDLKLTTITKSEETFWLFIVRENGVLEIYNLPDFKLVYLVKNFPLGSRVLVDSIQTTDHSYQNHTESMPVTKEILVDGMGLENSRPFLFARFDEELFIYEVFAYFESQVENHLKVRFKKHSSQDVFLKYPKMCFNKDEDFDKSIFKRGLAKHSTWLRPFTNICGYSGVFLCGPFPCWFIMTARGELRIHSMEIDGAVTSFAMFDNVNCPNGFLYFNINEELRFSVLSNTLEIDFQWPFKTVPIHQTVHYVNYHLESKTFAIVTSIEEDIYRLVRVGGEEKDYDLIERDSRYIPCKMEKFQLQLVSPVSWELIPGTCTELDEWEHVTCLKNVLLVSEGTSSGLKGYIAMGTNYSYGEDVTNRGRIWILDVIEVVPEPGKPLTKNKVKIEYCKEQKGPVTALCQVKGYLLSAIGQKIYIWQLKESQLIGIAFIDTQIYVHTAVSLRNLILIGDIYKSISLLRYQEETRTLSLVSRDSRSLQVYACEYFIDNSQMAFIVSDSDKNIIIYAYQPGNVESCGGTRLLRRADYHLGSHVNSFFRIRCKIPFKEIDTRLQQNYLNKHITMFATLDGSLGYLLPITEKTYRRLLMLQNLLTTNIQHIAGLNPKAFSLIKMHKLELLNPSKNILDGNLLGKFFNLSLNEKMEIAKKIGTSYKQVSKSK